MNDHKADAEIIKIISPLIRYWETCDESWWVKNNRSKFVYANGHIKEFLAIPKKFNMEGRYDGELPVAIHQFEAEFQKHDRKVEIYRDRVTSFEIHKAGRGESYQAWFCDKFPVIGERGQFLGVIAHNRAVKLASYKNLMEFKLPELINFNPPNDEFNHKEWIIIFYICQAFSTNMIETASGVPRRTIEDIQSRVYKKAGVKNRRQFLEYCYSRGFDNFIPQEILCGCKKRSFN